MKTKLLGALLISLLLPGLANAQDSEIDERSYNLGILGGFSEVVRLGVRPSH